MKSPVKSKALIAVLAASCLFQTAFAETEDFALYIQNTTGGPVRFSLKASEEGSWTDFTLQLRDVKKWRMPPYPSEWLFKMITNEGVRLYRLGGGENERYAVYLIKVNDRSGHLDLFEDLRFDFFKWIHDKFSDF